ncbi:MULTISPECIES: hypothetical protein [unclassified Mesorhizobium]|uniref:hypothetical protein n=1 Tax=unclassified Mesorhizobium TaxID=325217 RepID=UPI000BAF24F3|nr:MULTISPECIES: hypothetical protein [unclassified Mesorhizobium]TGT58606.1 hypothetical protein EN813_031635 [Mesorhizobium sp. M00.F.Ca.ET.170.01.1.1]AZO12072.1 hypothetical protein EJ074_25390 [Mesorhizobium sp. M3A.F.Ca.ET.080.04.2.1]PBB84364.1 hypothetical protein CK216_23585 [Mesorhizobium sp. WSM3876]RWB74790.1 MAG: hypothetical protein EOQ49_05245 [Mesorhizobium sp.]RWB89752.1 MAG: hypothetical protein EOQ52_11640 [Mesorhizobium sp.]
MNERENRRETGARKYPANTDPDPSDQFSQAAANNEKPHDAIGLTRKRGEVEDKTHQSDGQNPPGSATPRAATQKSFGAGRSSGQHSKDAKASKSGRQPGDYAKD